MTTAVEPAKRGAPPRWIRLAPVWLLAAVVYVPLLLTRPGEVGADTKSYLYLDPGRLLSDAPFMWDPGTGLGTVTHQVIGYSWPMGPFYFVLDAVGLPDWVAQRLWLGTVMLAAGVGVLFLLRALDWIGPDPRSRARGWDGGMLVAAFAYALSPYVLDYAARISVILLPWAALPWLLAFTVRAVRRGGWRDPVLFALVAMTAGSINITSLILVGLGPLTWLVYSVWITREATVAKAAAAAARIGALTIGLSAWWLSGLVLQGSFGIPILRYTESYEAVATASHSAELLRGLGYWFFYGNDKLGQWILPSHGYVSWVLPLSYLLPGMALLSAALTRFRHRLFFVILMALGLVVAVGGHPFDDPSPAGAVFKAFTERDLGLAFRSTPRAAPLVVLSLSVFLGAGVRALSARVPRLAVPTAALVVLLVVANLPALWVGQMVDRHLERDEEIPSYWHEATAWLDEQSHDTRVLEMPGSDFAAYRWGNTVDPVTPGLMDRPYSARELIPLGSPSSSNLLNAVDRPLQEDTFDPDALAPIARLLGVGDVVLRSDLEFERFRTPRPAPTWALFQQVPGLEDPVGFGEPTVNRPSPSLPMIDEVALGTPAGLEVPPPVAAFPVEDPLPIVRATPAQHPIVVAGDGDGLVSASAAGLLDEDRTVLYAATLGEDEELFDRVMGDEPALVITDSNRRRARRWGTIRENEGYTERAGEDPLVDDPTDNRLEVFPGSGDDDRTVSVQRGGATVSATHYGNPVAYTPGDRAAYAMDGDPRTAWLVGDFSEVEGERLVIELDEPVTTDRVRLLQPLTGRPNRFITELDLVFDGEETERVTLDDTSHAEPGQTVEFEERTFSRLELVVRDDTVGYRVSYGGVSGVGFAEVGLAGHTVEEIIRPPSALLDELGTRADERPLAFAFTRVRTNPAEPVREDEERAMARLVDLPSGRAFDLVGEARLSAHAEDEVIDEVLGLPSAAEGGITARSSARLPGDVSARAMGAVDGDLTTAWETPFETPSGNWIEVVAPEALTVDRLDLELLADRFHSRPARLRIEGDGGETRTVDVPDVTSADDGAPVAAPVTFEPLRSARFRVTVEGVRPTTTIDWYSAGTIQTPVGIAELGIPGVEAPPLPDRVSDTCRDDLVTVDGRPVPVRVTGTSGSATARDALPLELCATSLELPRGESVLRAAGGRETGIDVDTLTLTSGAGGAAVGAEQFLEPLTSAAPIVTVDDASRVSAGVEVSEAAGPYWFVLGQSHNTGWQASADDAGSLGEPVLVNGYANGWYVDGEQADTTIRLSWGPQRLVWAATALSALTLVLAVLLLWRNPRRWAGATGRSAVYEPVEAELDPPAAVRVDAPLQTTIGWSVAAGLLAAVLVAPVWPAGLGGLGFAVAPLVVGAATATGLRWAWGPVALRIVALGTIGLSFAFIVVKQAIERYPPDFNWPERFDSVHPLVLLGVALLVVDAAVRARVEHRAR